MITKEQITEYQELENQKTEKTVELRRIVDFLARKPDNKDNANATKGDKIFVKFAGTACYLPKGIFTAELRKRKTELETELSDLESQFNAL